VQTHRETGAIKNGGGGPDPRGEDRAASTFKNPPAHSAWTKLVDYRPAAAACASAAPRLSESELPIS